MQASVDSGLCGILNLDKPRGWTSHDMVSFVRRVLGQRAAGHAGTLDPMATGVLLICLGDATRVSEYLMGGGKIYRAVVRLGSSTDTLDATGTVVSTCPVPELDALEIESALAGFIGEIEQIPPAYSALKLGGIPAYKRARRGEAVLIAARRVSIESIRLLGWASPNLVIEVKCGPGTYIRSLAQDIGGRLGCDAHLADLVRLRSGKFDLQTATSPVQLTRSADAGQALSLIHPIELALEGFAAVDVDETQANRLRHGLAIACTEAVTNESGWARAIDGHLVALLRCDHSTGVWRPYKVFGA